MGRRRRFSRGFVVGSVVAVLLLAAPVAALALKAPGLASSAQYKAFIEYVKKLDGMSSKPTSAERKNTYEAKLTAKETAAAHKADALFKRASREAHAEANEEAKTQVLRVKAKEDEELEELSARTASKFERIEAAYHSKFGLIVKGHHNRETALKAQIADLRARKAEAAAGTPKEKFQERIEKKGAEVKANREDEATKRKELKAATAKQKGSLKETSEAEEAAIGEAAKLTIEKIRDHWNKAFETRKASLNGTRENRIGYLERKLEQGRAAIAAMPSAG